MKLHAPRFEKNLRRGVRAAVRALPELRRARKRHALKKQYNLSFLVRPGLAVLLGFTASHVARVSGNPAAGLAVVGIWTFFLVFVLAQSLLLCLYSSSDLGAFANLPVADGTVFRWQLQKFFRKALVSLLDVSAGFIGIGLLHEFTAMKWVAVSFLAVLAWLVMVALAFIAAWRFPRFPYGSVVLLAVLLLMGIGFGRAIVAAPLIALLDHSAPVVNVILPTGWVVLVFQTLVDARAWVNSLWLIPALGLIWAIRNSVARIEQAYFFQEATLPEAPDLLPGEDVAEAREDVAEKPRRVAKSEIEEHLSSRNFFAPLPWQERGWLERWLWRWLNARERALAEFAFPGGVVLTARWKKLLRNLLVVVVLAIVFHWTIPKLLPWVMAVGLFTVCVQLLRLLLGNGVAFRPFFCSGVNIPAYAAFGIGFRELAGMLFKYTVVQIPLVMLLAGISGAVIAGLLREPLGMGISIGVRAAGILIGVRLVTVTMSFSSGTNDSSRFFSSFWILLLIVCFGVIFLGLAVAGAMVPLPWGWVFWGASLLAAYGLFRFYGWFFHGNRFDLMKLPQS